MTEALTEGRSWQVLPHGLVLGQGRRLMALIRPFLGVAQADHNRSAVRNARAVAVWFVTSAPANGLLHVYLGAHAPQDMGEYHGKDGRAQRSARIMWGHYRWRGEARDLVAGARYATNFVRIPLVPTFRT